MYLETNGQFRTDSLFVERIHRKKNNEGIIPVYTLSEREESKEYKSLYEVFINSLDEYDFAMKAFKSKAHLDHLKGLKWFRESFRGLGSFRGYDAWLEDMRERDASIAKKVLMDKAADGDVSAAKKLADMSKPAVKSTAGRPKKEDIKREAIRHVEERFSDEQDLQRISSNIVKLKG